MRPITGVRRRLLAAGAAGIAAITVVSTVGVAAAFAPATAAAPAATATYAVNQPLCQAPADPRAMRCYGVKRVSVPRGTMGAYRVRTVASDGGATPNAGLGPRHGYTPAQLAAAYRFNPNLRRSNLTVGIVLWHDAPNVLSDLNKFNKKYHLKKETKRSFRKVNERGRTSPLPKRDRGAAGEIALDTQAVRAVCHTCRILLVEADGPYDTDLANAVNTAVRLGATIVTNSYGMPERKMSARTQAAYRHPGVAMFVATGDSGWFGWDYANSPGDVGDSVASFPATSPYAIAVGGTTLTVDGRNRRVKETVWNNNGASDDNGEYRQRPLGASGGGCSRFSAAPAWQRRTPGYAAAHCNGKRLTADLAVVADPRTGFDVYDSYGSGGWVTIGGTSLSSPLAAGMLALAGGPKGSRYPATAVYGNGTSVRGIRYDVSTGGNGYCSTATLSSCSDAVRSRTVLQTGNPNNMGRGLLDCSYSRRGRETVLSSKSRECNATTGFDGPSGVGAPASPSLFRRTDPYLGLRWSGAIRHGRSKSFRVKIIYPLRGTKVTSLTWSWGDGKSTAGTPSSTKHTYRKKGRYTVTFSSRDSRGQLAVGKRAITVR